MINFDDYKDIDPKKAVDLGQLKKLPSDLERAAQQTRLLFTHELVCVCGEKIRNDGIRVYFLQEAFDGSGKYSPTIATQSFHNVACECFLAAIKFTDPLPVAFRSIPDTEWLNEPEEEDGTDG